MAKEYTKTCWYPMKPTSKLSLLLDCKWISLSPNCGWWTNPEAISALIETLKSEKPFINSFLFKSKRILGIWCLLGGWTTIQKVSSWSQTTMSWKDCCRIPKPISPEYTELKSTADYPLKRFKKWIRFRWLKECLTVLWTPILIDSYRPIAG